MSGSGVVDRTVVVTGAAGGIGAAVAARLIGAGARVALWDSDGDAVEAVARGLAAQPGVGPDAAAPRVFADRVDVTDPDAVEAAWRASGDVLGAPGALVHAAGVLRGGSALTAAPDDIAAELSVNLGGTVVVTRHAGRRFRDAGAGAITVVSSNAATAPRVDLAAYGAAKAAATAFTRSLALELAPHGVRCNIVSPGSTDTPMLRRAPDGGGAGVDAAARAVAGDPARYRLGIPLGRVAHAEDIAEAVLFLTSDAARHITMHDLRIDGGASLDA